MLQRIDAGSGRGALVGRTRSSMAWPSGTGWNQRVQTPGSTYIYLEPVKRNAPLVGPESHADAVRNCGTMAYQISHGERSEAAGCVDCTTLVKTADVRSIRPPSKSCAGCNQGRFTAGSR